MGGGDGGAERRGEIGGGQAGGSAVAAPPLPLPWVRRLPFSFLRFLALGPLGSPSSFSTPPGKAFLCACQCPLPQPRPWAATSSPLSSQDLG